MIHKLPSPKTTKKAKRIGRGMGSGVGGHTVGRGTKGQRSRSGYSLPRPGFEGGQMPLSRRIPKLRGTPRGSSRDGSYFRSKQNKSVVQLSALDKSGLKTVTPESILEAKLVKVSNADPEFKVLYDGEIKAKLTVQGVAVSKKAKQAIEKAGGKVE